MVYLCRSIGCFISPLASMEAHSVAVSDLQLFLIICVDQLDQGKKRMSYVRANDDKIYLVIRQHVKHTLYGQNGVSHPCGSSLNCLEYTTV